MDTKLSTKEEYKEAGYKGRKKKLVLKIANDE